MVISSPRLCDSGAPLFEAFVDGFHPCGMRLAFGNCGKGARGRVTETWGRLFASRRRKPCAHPLPPGTALAIPLPCLVFAVEKVLEAHLPGCDPKLRVGPPPVIPVDQGEPLFDVPRPVEVDK